MPSREETARSRVPSQASRPFQTAPRWVQTDNIAQDARSGFTTTTECATKWATSARAGATPPEPAPTATTAMPSREEIVCLIKFTLLLFSTPTLQFQMSHQLIINHCLALLPLLLVPLTHCLSTAHYLHPPLHQHQHLLQLISMKTLLILLAAPF